MKLKISRKKLHRYWKAFCILQDKFYGEVNQLERVMSNELGISDMEFIKDQMFGGDWIGIGNVSRTVKLVQFDPE